MTEEFREIFKSEWGDTVWSTNVPYDVMWQRRYLALCGHPYSSVTLHKNDGYVTVHCNDDSDIADITFMPMPEGMTEQERIQLAEEAHNNHGWNEQEAK